MTQCTAVPALPVKPVLLSRLYLGAIGTLPDIDQSLPIEVAAEEQALSGKKAYLFTTHLVSTFSPLASGWFTALRKKVRADRSSYSDSRYASLYASELDLRFLARALGGWDQSNSTEFEPADLNSIGVDAYVSKVFVVVLLKDKSPVGYCTFQVKWTFPACPKKVVDVELELGEVWLAPYLRGYSLSGWLCQGILDAYRLCRAALDRHCNKGSKRVAQLALDVSGDVCSRSGEDFLRSTLDLIAFAEYEDTPPQFKYVRMQYDPRW